VYETLNLTDLIQLLIKKLWLILLVSFIGFLTAFGITKIVLKPVYTSTISLYVSNTEQSQSKIDYNDISAAQKLANTYAVIMKSDSVLVEVISSSNLYQYTPKQLRKMMTVKPVANTEVMEVDVTTQNPQLSADIANAIARIAPSKIKEITKTGDVELIDHAVPNPNPSSPNVKLNCILGILAGIFLSVAYIVVKDLLDMHIKGEGDIKKRYNIPLLGSIPVLNSPAKGGYIYYEG
jgi:succinoglycan biosynthesis transport protein ExoP